MTTPKQPQRQPEQRERESDVEKRLADLELQLAQTRAALPGGTLPEHSAGPGDEVADTWSQRDQEMAYAEANGITYPYHPPTKPGQGPKTDD